MTLNGYFALNSVLRRYVWSFGVYSFRSLTTVKLIVNVVGNFKPKRTASASRGFLAIERLSGYYYYYTIAESLYSIGPVYEKIILLTECSFALKFRDLITLEDWNLRQKTN